MTKIIEEIRNKWKLSTTNSIEKIHIENFRNLKNVDLEIKPITLLFGPNASGKSTILKAIAFLKETYKDLGKNIDFDNSQLKALNLKSFKDIVYNNNESLKITFKLNCKLWDGNKHRETQISFIYGKSDIFYFKKEKKSNCWLQDIVVKDFETNSIISQSEISFFNENPIYNYFECFFPKNIFYKEEKKNKDYIYVTWRYINYFDIFPRSVEEFNIRAKAFIGPFKDINFFSDVDKENLNGEKKQLNISREEKNILNREKKLWDSFDKNTQIEAFNNVKKLYDFFYDLIPGGLEEIFEILHLPTVRNPLKTKYNLVNNRISKDDDKLYYGLLNKFIFEQKLFVNKIKNKINKKASVKDIIKYLDLVFENIEKYKKFLKYPPLYIVLINLLNNNKNITVKDFRAISNNYQKKKFEKIFKESLDEKDGFEKFIYLKNILSDEETNEIINELKENNIYALFCDNDNRMDWKAGTFENSFIMVNYFLNKIGFGRKLLLETNEKSQLCTIKTITDNCEINVESESSGFIQLLPIILSFVLSIHATEIEYYREEEFSTLLIEQPEIHLHPKLQSKFIESFSDLLKFTDNIRTKYIIETHSEHIIRKLQVMIAKQEIPLNDISVNYFVSGKNGTEVVNLKLAENGNFLTPWPNGFFDEAAQLSFDLLEAQIHRMN